jgi:hypothetical protein
MSWLFSQALVEEYSAGTSLDGEPSSQLNVTPTQHKFWRNDKTIDASDHSRFGLTSQLLTVARGAELLMSYLAAFHARTSAPPAPELESAAIEAASGPTWRGSFAKYDPAAGSSWRTPQCSLLGDSDEFLETWPRWGSMRSGVSYLRPIPVLPICASAFGLWPTPTVFGNHNQPGASASSGWGLSSAVKQWTTPSASDAHRGGTIADRMTGTSLAQQVNTPRRWPTPTVGSQKCAGTLQEWGGSGARKTMRQLVSPEEMTGQLNPTWVEWLMGWPIGWTELKPLAMVKFREWQQQHGQSSPDNHKEAA